MTASSLALPDDVVAWIESVTKDSVISTHRIPAGATREGWFIDTRDANGNARALFLRFSRGPRPPAGMHVLQTEAAVMQALERAGSRVPRIIGVHSDKEAVLSERVSGETWFYRIADPGEQVGVAQDFIRCLAHIHRLDPNALGVAALGPVRSAREHALERIAAIRDRGTAPDGTIDPLLRLSTDWLERNVPTYDGPVVLVQGDTGPGNFMYENGTVTAVVDYELCHWGDPMDDIAWLSLRTVQDTFTHLPDRLVEYEQLSGHAIDIQRIWYYRLFAECTMATLAARDGRDRPDDPERNATRDLGNALIYPQLHRRLWIEALAAVMELELQQPALPERGAEAEWHHHYSDVLANLQTIVPRINDPLASQWTKGLARVVKYLQEADASGRDCVQLELNDISTLLKRQHHDLRAARTELDAAWSAGTVDDRDYVQVLWNRVMRNDYLMRTASGALREREWPPLVD